MKLKQSTTILKAAPTAIRASNMKNRDYKEQILRENYDEYVNNGGEGLTFREYVKREAENDPNFFRWLFDDRGLGDFDYGLSEEQMTEYNEFIENL